MTVKAPYELSSAPAESQLRSAYHGGLQQREKNT